MALTRKKLLAFVSGTLWLAIIAARPVLAETLIWAPDQLSELIEEGLTQNQDIQGLEAQVASLKEEVPFAGSLEDPRLGVAIVNLPVDSFRFDREPMTQKQLFIAQKVPWFGKLSLRSQKQALRASRQQAVLEARKLELARQIASTYYELIFIDRALHINERLTSLVNQLLRVAETKYASGQGLQQDVLQAQVESSKLLDEKIVLQKKRRTLEDRLNELLNRPEFAPVPPPAQLDYPNLRLDVKSLAVQSLQGNPWLRVKQFEIDEKEVDIQLAKKDYYPNFDFKVAYGQRDEDRTGRSLPDFVSASVTVNVPLWQHKRQKPKLNATIKSKDAALSSYHNLVQTLPHRVDAIATEIRDTQENYKLYADALILQAGQWARSSLAAYEVGKVEFNTMINAQVRLLRFELQADRFLYSIYQKRAELEEILGGPLPQ
ncbi:MAG: TolC family protein [Deltaproteobacteria bacterium]|nr:TolC family protein [Deltaproteobacteria bacterium]MBW2070137.1 TolC family protein [Deltaproteobacteria bacterium]